MRCTRGAILDVVVDLRPDVVDVPGAPRRAARPGQPRRAVHPAGSGARLPDPGRGDRGLLPDGHGVRPGSGAGRALGRPRVRLRVAGPAGGDLRARPLVPGLRSRAGRGEERVVEPERAGRSRRRLPKPARRCTSSWPTCSRSAEASPVQVCGTRSIGSARSCRCSSRRCRPGRRRSTGRFRRSGTSATPGWPTLAGERVIDFQDVEPPRRQLQRAGAPPPQPRRAASAPAHAARPPDLGAVPDVVLRRELGLLPQPGRTRPPPRRRVRGRHRCHAGGRQPHLRRVRAARRLSRGDPRLEPRLPPLPRQRQPLRRGRRHLPGPACWPRPNGGTRTGSSSRPAPSARSSGSAATKTVLDRIRAGLVLACVGDDGPVVYKRSRRGDAEVDRAAAHVLRGRGLRDEVIDFSPYGNDERQFCSPGFDLPVGAITRSGHDRSERHHTSADDLASIDPAALADTLGVCLAILGVLEDNATLRQPQPQGRAAARPARPVPILRRPGRAGRARVGAAVGDEPGRRRAHDARRGRAGRAAVRGRRRGGDGVGAGGPGAARGAAPNDEEVTGDEGGAVLRRAGHAPARVHGRDPQADGQDRLPADPLAPHEVLRALRAHRLRPLPRATRPTSSRSSSSTTRSGSRTTSRCPRAARS